LAAEDELPKLLGIGGCDPLVAAFKPELPGCVELVVDEPTSTAVLDSPKLDKDLSSKFTTFSTISKFSRAILLS
jgi:hypothetical protein